MWVEGAFIECLLCARLIFNFNFIVSEFKRLWIFLKGNGIQWRSFFVEWHRALLGCQAEDGFGEGEGEEQEWW